MAARRTDGFSVETTLVLRIFRDETLLKVAEGLPTLRQAIQKADPSVSAYPVVARDAQKDRTTSLDKILKTMRKLEDTVHTHIDDITAVPGKYKQAEKDATTVVTSRLSGSWNTPAIQPSDSNRYNGSNGSAEGTAPTPVGPGGHPAPPSGATRDAIFALYRKLEGLFGTVGLADLIKPAGAQVYANTVDSEPFRQSADLLEQALLSATRQHSLITDGLKHLHEHWTGNAYDAHRDATITAYRSKFDHLYTQLRNLIEKDRASATIIDHSNSRLTQALTGLSVVGIVALAVSVTARLGLAVTVAFTLSIIIGNFLYNLYSLLHRKSYSK